MFWDSFFISVASYYAYQIDLSPVVAAFHILHSYKHVDTADGQHSRASIFNTPEANLNKHMHT